MLFSGGMSNVALVGVVIVEFMATIATVDFGSESDEDYELSSHSDTSEDEIASEQPRKKRKKDFNADGVLARMKLSFQKSVERPPVRSQDELRRWQVKSPPETRLNATRDSLDKYLTLSCSKPQKSLVDEPSFELSCFKASVRQDSVLCTRPAPCGSIHSDKVRIRRKVKYAGQVTEIEEVVDRSSVAYRNYANANQRREDLGDMAAIMEAVETTKSINTVEKSQADWEAFRAANPQMAESMEKARKGGYVEQQAFLNRNASAEQAHYVRARKEYERQKQREEQ